MSGREQVDRDRRAGAGREDHAHQGGSRSRARAPVVEMFSRTATNGIVLPHSGGASVGFPVMH
jgi:hypothetical protein